MKDNLELLKQEALKFGITITSEHIALFRLLYKEMIEANQKFNLTTITDEKEVIVKHFLDSLSCFSVLTGEKSDPWPQSCIDIGTGAGFPSLPMLFCTQNMNFTLLDSTKKKTDFIRSFLLQTSKYFSSRTSVIWGRAEDLAQDKKHRAKYDICIARSVALLNVLAEICIPFLKVGGIFIAMKGERHTEEIGPAEKGIKLLGGELEDIKEIRLPTDIKHYLVVIRKIKNTPPVYPRSFNTIKKGKI